MLGQNYTWHTLTKWLIILSLLRLSHATKDPDVEGVVNLAFYFLAAKSIAYFNFFS